MQHSSAVSRRSFIRRTASAAIVGSLASSRTFAATSSSPFKVAVINDEISQDLDHACSVAANEFGMRWMELRSMWGKGIMSLSDDQLADAEKTLAKYSLQVTDIASPLFKTNWPGAPKSQYSSGGDLHGAAQTTFKQQDDILDKACELAKRFKTNKVRCFDFWRIDDQAPFRAAIDDKLREAADKAAQKGIVLVLENEFECNTATARESVRTLGAVQSRNLALNWDPANAVMRGELDAFPVGWQLLPKERIHHCHVKNAVKNDAGKVEWSPVGKGFIDWTAQFRDLKRMGYRDAVSLETHWRGGGTPEQSSRLSWAGMKQALVDAKAL